MVRRELALLGLACSLLAGAYCAAEDASPEKPAATAPVINVIPTDEPTNVQQLRRVLVGPGVHQPEPYPGYTGFVGWEGVCRTKTGALLMTFSSGYWHGSPATPLDDKMRELLKKYGIPEVEAPRGGRAHIMRSEDGGRTWTNPAVLIDTPHDDRSPDVVQLSNGALMCSFFVWSDTGIGIIRSFDDGKTWEKQPHYLKAPFKWTATDGPPIELPDHSVLLVAYAGFGVEGENSVQGVFRSADFGDTWEHIATLKAPFSLDEPSIACLPDGRLVTICRREGAVAWSDDKGYTWTTPAALPFKMYDPWLLTLKDGTLVCVHASYTEGKRGVRAILSSDGGKTWTAAGPDYGFAIDPTTYGYSRGVQLPDGSIYVVYISTGGHTVEQVKRQSIFAIRFRVLEGGKGIELLPAPGSPTDAGNGEKT